MAGSTTIAGQEGSPPTRSVKSRAIRAGFWLVGIRIFQQIVALSRPVILARLLAPDDFGVIGIAVMTRMIIERVGISGGLKDALIRKDDLEKDQIAAAWTFEVLRLIVLGGAVAAAAPAIADFFNSDAATPVIRITGLEMALTGMTSIGMVFVRKELEFRKEFLYRLIPTLASAGVTIWLAFELRSFWALALGHLTQTVLMLVLSYVLAPYFVRPTWNFRKLKGIAGFAVWTSVSNLIASLTGQIDRFFVGRILGPTGLGLYVVAGRITNLVSVEMINGVARVGFPAFAKIQKNRESVNRNFSQLVSLTSLILIPMTLFTAVWAPEVVGVLLGPQWDDAVGAVRVLAIATPLLALGHMFVTVLRSMGDAFTAAVVEAVRFVVTVAVAYPFISNYELAGAGYALITGLTVAFVVILVRSRGKLDTGYIELARLLLYSAILSVGLFAAIAIRDVESLNLVGTLLLGAVAFGAVYLMISALMFRIFHTGPIQIYTQFRKKTPKMAPAAPA